MVNSRSRHFCLFGSAVALLVIVGLSVGLGVGLTRDDDKKDTAKSNANVNAASSGSATATATSSGTAPKASVSPLATWDWTSTSKKMYGISAGNLFSLERWMDEDWFTGLAGDDVWDEWTLCERLGTENATKALEAHYATFTSDNISTIASSGFNHIRVPISFWAFINTTDEEPYVAGIQLPYLDKIAAACYEHGLYILLDLHGLPGSQNGLQQSGHNTSDINFWSDDNQSRSDQTVQAAIDYITNSTYRSVFTGIAICNEPVTYSSGQLAILTKFYERSYTKFAAVQGQSLAMIFHDAYQGMDYWLSFVNGKNASILMIEDHPYPGNFPLQSDQSDILSQICSKASGYADYPIPVAVTEFSVTTGIISDSFFKTFYEAQASAFTTSGGAIFWSWVTYPATNPVLSNNTNYMTYSFSSLLDLGVAPLPSNNETTESFLASFSSGCSLATETWATTPVSASASAGVSQAVLRKRHQPM